MSDMFEYENEREAAAILGAVEDLGLDFVDELCGDGEIVGAIYVDLELQSEYDYIMNALNARRHSE